MSYRIQEHAVQYKDIDKTNGEHLVTVKRLPWYAGMQRVHIWSLSDSCLSDSCLSTTAHVTKTNQDDRFLEFLLAKYELFSQAEDWSVLQVVVRQCRR